MLWYRLLDLITALIAVFSALVILGLLTHWIRIVAVESQADKRYIVEYVVAVGSPKRLIKIQAGCWIQDAGCRIGEAERHE